MTDETIDLRRRRFISKPTVLDVTALSSATLDRKVRAGTFPPPIRISANRVAWRESDVSTWLADPSAWLNNPHNETPTF